MIKAADKLPLQALGGDSMRGVVGLCSEDACAHRLFLSISNLQHRGQVYCGMSTGEPGLIRKIRTHHGLVARTFHDDLVGLDGSWGIGSISNRDRQPDDFPRCRLGLFHSAMDGYFTNGQAISDELISRGHVLGSEEDLTLLGTLIGQQPDPVAGICKAFEVLEGPLSLVMLTPDGVFAARGPDGGTPLMAASKTTEPKAGLVASESRACDFGLEWFIDTDGEPLVNAELLRKMEELALDWRQPRDIKPGEIVRLSANGLESCTRVVRPVRMCSFEWVYFGHPASVIDGVSVALARQRMGGFVAEDDNVEADLVAPIFNSGLYHCLGYAVVSGILLGAVYPIPVFNLRTYNLPIDSRLIEKAMKLWPIRHLVRGKRIILVDDSIRSAITIRDLIVILRAMGAVEVHVRIGSPPSIRYCPYCPPPKEAEDYIAARMSVEEIRVFIGADSLRYQRLERVCEAIVPEPQDLLGLQAVGTILPSPHNLCVGCFLKSGCYLRDAA